MLSFLLIYLGISIAAAAVIVYFIVTSPEGWEDKDGFHYLHEDSKLVKQLQFPQPVLEKGMNKKFYRNSEIN